jgi:hypothetical protein
MAILNSGFSLLEHAKRTDASGKQELIAELLSQSNGILDDIVFKEGNLSTGEQVAIRTGLPAVYWRKYNQPIPASSSTTAQNTFPVKTLEHWSENDQQLMDLGGDSKQARLNELTAATEAMSQEFASNYFYGDASSDETKFSGIATTYNSISAGESKDNVITGGGSGSDNASIYLIAHGVNKVYCAFPKGSQAGLKHVDHGKTISQDSTGLMSVYREQLTWASTLVVKDWRYAARVCNIDVSNLSGGSAADLPELMIKAAHKLPNTDGACFYMNRELLTYLDIQCRNDVQSGGQLSYQNVGGKQIATFRGIKIKKVDSLLNTEAAVS